MKLQSCSKLVLSVMLCSGLLAASMVSATVKPEVASLAEQSDFIVSAIVMDVAEPGEAQRKITIEVRKFFKGDPKLHASKRITFSYERLGKGNIDFQKAKDDKAENIFFLRKLADSATTDGDSAESSLFGLVDAWFGMEPVGRSIKAELEKIEKKRTRK